MLCLNDVGNIILHQVKSINDQVSISEIKPLNKDSSIKCLVLDNDKIKWLDYFKIRGSDKIKISTHNGILTIDTSLNDGVIINDKLIGTNIYYVDDRVGVGRSPLLNYKIDVAIPKNTLMTAFHIGDGNVGFSMGNGTNNGFIPEILGMGYDENDAGLYLIGRAGNNVPSNIPLIILDAHNNLNGPIINRPIFGITNSNYNDYKLIVNYNGNVSIGKLPSDSKLDVNGIIKAHDFINDSSVSMNDLIMIINDMKCQINKLNERISQLEKN